tara:strand:- start:60 stop:1073 length:1014 start_codon:yes stop_codon:yes gene_type:complete
MIIILLGIISILLVSAIYLQYIKVNTVVDIDILEWPFLNIIDENDNLVDIICIRGPLDKKEDIESFKKYKKQNKLIIGCSSYLSFPNKCLNPIPDYNTFFFKGERIDKLVDGWLHPFKDDNRIQNNKKLLLSESDFVDNVDFLRNYDNSLKKIKYDFICYCPSDDNSCDVGWHHHNKNWSLAKKTIETACNDLNLNGVLIGRKKCPLDIEESKLERHEQLEYFEFVTKISESRFIIISSYEDASPRVIGEALLLNTPILVNKDIIGGWKYVNEESGVFYDSLNIKSKIEEIMEKKFNPREYFLKNYGIQNSGEKFRDFVVSIDPSFSKYKQLRFSIS